MGLYHRRRKYERCLRPISFFGSIWELYVLDLKTKFFCRKENQLHFSMDNGLTVLKQCLQFGQKYPKCLTKFQPNLSAQAQKFRIFEKSSLNSKQFCDMYYIKRNLVACYQIINKFNVTRLFCFIGQPCIALRH